MTSHRWIVAMVVLFAGIGGESSEADVLCRSKKGVLAARPDCTRRETRVDPAALGLVGPKGDKGDPGSPGDPGDPGSLGVFPRWVIVRGDGTVAAQSEGIVSVTRPEPGVYYVRFAASVANHPIAVTNGCREIECPFAGAPLAHVCGEGPDGGECGTAFDDPTHVGVFTQNTTQTDTADVPFHLVVF